MRILMITASLPYPTYSGGAIRAYGILSGLHTAGHDITLLSFHDPANPIELSQTPLVDLCEQIITVPPPTRTTRDRLHDLLLTNQADLAQRLESDAMHTQLAQLMSSHDFDLLQFEGIEVNGYLLAARKLNPTIPTIYDAFNAEAVLQKVIANVDWRDYRRIPNAIYSEIQARRLDRFERDICQAATAVIAVSDEDADELSKFRKDGKVYVVPSGIFAHAYTTPLKSIKLKPNALVFTGKMDYRPNVDAVIWFAEQVLPRVCEQIEAHLYVVGQKPHKRLAPLRDQPSITLTGWVKAVQPYLHAADLYVAPLRMGSGTRLKILEAMASGCAIVATNLAASGLGTEAKNHMCIADEAQAAANDIIQLLQDAQQRTVLGEGARTYVQSHYDWSVLVPRLLQAYKDIGLG